MSTVLARLKAALSTDPTDSVEASTFKVCWDGFGMGSQLKRQDLGITGSECGWRPQRKDLRNGQLGFSLVAGDPSGLIDAMVFTHN